MDNNYPKISMTKFKRLKSFFSINLILFVVLGNISLPALAYEKDSVNLEQARTETMLDNSGANINKISSSSKSQEFKNLPADSLKVKEKIGTEKIQAAKEKKKNYVEGEILVKYKPGKINLQTSSGRASALNFIRSKSLEKKEDLRKNNISVLKIKDAKTVEQKIAELQKDSNVEYVQPNFQYYPLSINTNDTYKDNLWGLDNTGQTVNTVAGVNDADIDAPEAWAISEATTSTPIIVAVIDSGVAYNHPDLVANMWDGGACVGEDSNGNSINGGCQHGYDYEDNDKIPLPTTSSHGTHIAGTIAAVKNNGEGIIGVAPQAKIMALKSSLTTAENVKAINFAKYNGAKVINASWGDKFNNTTGAYSHFFLDQALYNTIRDFPGLFVAAAGNDGQNHDSGNLNTMIYPAGFRVTSTAGPGLDNIIVVAATDSDDKLAVFPDSSGNPTKGSDYGVSSVDVGAPGGSDYKNSIYHGKQTIYSTVADSPLMSENFNSVTAPNLPSGWIKGGTNNKWATYDFSGDKVLYGQVPSFPYDNETNSTVTSPSYNLGGSTGGAVIDFDTRCDTEYITTEWFDYMALEVSSNGVDFTEILKWDEALLDLFNGDSSDIGGAFYSFKKAIPSQYLSSNFKFRLRWFADPFVNEYDGCWVNNIKITKYSDGSDGKYDYYYGTSMAAPHVAGLAALIWGYKPELSYFEVKNTILTTGNDLASLNGKTVTGKRINARNALNSLSEKKPPYAVAIDNHKDARPVSGVNEADVVYEFPVEGSITRLMAIYNPDSGINLSTEIGPVRSARPYFARTASEHGAIYAHAGGSTAALQSLANHEYSLYNLEALATDGESYFWRDNSRAMPHNLYTSIERLNNFREDIYLTGGSFTSPWIFSDSPSSLNDIGFSQGIVIANYENVNYNVKWVYNESDKHYYRQSYENGSYVDYLDKNNNQVSTTNLAVQYTATDPMTELIASEGDALLCREGNCVDGKWRKNSTDDNVKFYINNGNDEFDFKTGKLWIHVTNYTATLPDSAHTILSSIAITTPATKLSYFVGEPLDITGLVVTGTYSDGSTQVETVTADNVSGFNSSAPVVGQVLIITVGERTTTYNIDIVAVPDTTAPVITLNGPDTVNLFIGDDYEDAGATAIDDIDGVIAPVIIGGDIVDTGTIGTYIVTYNISDSAGNAAVQVVRTVIVSEPADTTPPVITLLGEDPVTLQAGATYTDAGATATDNVDGDISASIVTGGDTVDVNTLGIYTITYNISDAAGNPATEVTRTVNVVDATAPVITLLGENPVTIPVNTAYEDAGATALDNYDGDLTANIVIINSVDTANVGAYQVSYNVTDAAGNPATEVVRTVNVVDVSTPIITLLGNNPATVEVGSEYADAGATAADDVDGNITANIVTVNPVNSNAIGTYTVTYNVTDSAGNAAPAVVRIVNVVDTTAPIITLLGDNPASVEAGYQYTDAGATANDNYDGDLTNGIVVVNNVDSNTVGTYTVTYNVSDSSGNPADEVTRTVNVTADNTLPVITLNGGDVIIYEGANYEDASATALDNTDGDITEDIVVTGLETVDTNTPGVYTISYNVNDSNGNSATEVNRIVTVLALEDNQAALTSNMTINASSTEVMIGSNAPDSSTISIPSSINNANLNLSALMSGTDATLSTGLTINSETSVGEVSVQIPQNTLMSGGAGWDGVVNLPQVQENSSVTVTPDSGYSASVSSVLEIGYGDVALTFDQAVRIKLTGQAGKYIGYSRNGAFTPITATCSADSQAAGNALAAGGDCKIDVGSDLIIWTKHFTKFATYTQTVIPAPTPTPSSTSGGGGGGGGGGASTPTDTSAPTNVSITINNGAATTTSRTVTLTLSASDSSSIQMMISSSTTFSGASWENYSTTKSWLLTGENGIKTVYVKFKDAYSNTSGVVNDSISLNFSGVIEAPKVEPKVLGEKITNIFTDFIKAQKSLIKKIDKALTKRLAGKILLQVQDHGEAWYVDVISQNRFYLADGARAFDALRKFGLGITNKDLAKIPVGIEKRFLDNDSDADGLADKLEEGLGTDKNKKDTDGDGVSDYDEVVKNQTNPLGTGKLIYDNKLLNRLRGRIVLQVESRGEAWYINPADGKRYYMKDGGAAYQIMRFLSLGITNDNIRKINIGD